MSGISTISIMGRVANDVVSRTVKTKKGELNVYDLRVAVNSWVAGKDVVTFYNVTLWPGRFEGMLKMLEKGKAIFISGEFYMSSYTTENGSRANKLVVELGQLKFCLRDSLALIARKEKEQKESEKQEDQFEEKVKKEVFDESELVVKINNSVEEKRIPLKREFDEIE